MTLEEKLQAGRFVLTAEVTPPVSMSRDDLLAKALPLRGLADAVNVTDGAGAKAHMSALAAAAIFQAEGIEPVLQITTRDRNRLALQSDLMGAAALGLRNLLILRGDNPDAGDQPDAKAVFDLDPRQVMTLAAQMRDDGKMPSGKGIGGKAAFLIGAADNPIDPPAGWKPDGLAAKVKAGAQFAQTQFCMDAGVVARYVERLAVHGLSHLKLIVGVAPLKTAKSARWMREKLFGTIIPDAIVARMESASEPALEGQRIAIDLISELKNIRGVAGVHLMAPNHEEALPAVLKAVKGFS